MLYLYTIFQYFYKSKLFQTKNVIKKLKDEIDFSGILILKELITRHLVTKRLKVLEATGTLQWAGLCHHASWD